MIAGEWKTVLIDQSVDDDLSSEVDLGANYEFLTVLIPTLDGSHTTTVHIAKASGGTFYPIYQLDADGAGDFTQITIGVATSHALTFRIGGVQYIKVKVGTGVSTDKTFYVRGFNRE